MSIEDSPVSPYSWPLPASLEVVALATGFSLSWVCAVSTNEL